MWGSLKLGKLHKLDFQQFSRQFFKDIYSILHRRQVAQRRINSTVVEPIYIIS